MVENYTPTANRQRRSNLAFNEALDNTGRCKRVVLQNHLVVLYKGIRLDKEFSGLDGSNMEYHRWGHNKATYHFLL